MAIVNKVRIEIAGNKIRDFIHLTIDQTINQPHNFQLVCRREMFEQAEDSPLSSSIKKIGSVITVLIEGINSGINKKDLYFKGIITDISISEAQSNQEITFSGHSPDTLLDGYPACRSFENKTLKQIAEEVISPYPRDQISLVGDPSHDGTFPYIVQYRESNYEFLRRLAARMGEWFFFNGHKLIFGDYERTSEKGVLGINISNFSIGARIVPLKFKLHRYTFQESDHTVFKSSNIDITNSLNTIGKHVYDQSLNSYPEEAGSYIAVEFINDDGSAVASKPGPGILQREKQKLASKMVVVNGTSTEPIVLGNVLKIKSLDSKHNETDIGDYMITSIRHSFDNSMNYENNFTGIPAEIKITPESDIIACARCETQSAYVTDNHDPQKWGRVRVHFWWQEEGQKSPWIRTVNLSGGDGSGSYFVPEINSEVLVGFEGGDPQKPYIMGAMRNKIWKPDEKWVNQSNDFKSIRSRSGHTIEFNDTQGGEELCIYNGTKDDPANMMRLKVSKSGYEIFSKGPINLTSNDKVNIKGKEIHLVGDKTYMHATKVASMWVDDGGRVELSSSEKTFVQLVNDNINLHADDPGKVGLYTGDQERLIADIEGTTISGPKISVKADAVAEINGGVVKIN